MICFALIKCYGMVLGHPINSFRFRAVIYVKIVYIPFSFMKKSNPPLVVQLLPIFHHSVSTKVLLFFFKI